MGFFQNPQSFLLEIRSIIIFKIIFFNIETKYLIAIKNRFSTPYQTPKLNMI
jgi:hypothetical protein